MSTTISAEVLAARHASSVGPGAFDPSRHFYPRVLNAQIHPLVAYFMRLSTERLVHRYCHLNPRVSHDKLTEILREQPKHFRWSGADLFHVTNEEGDRKMVIIETNSCPSGNKSMPILSDDAVQGGYRRLLETAFVPLIKSRKLPKGDLAIIFDKNFVEVSGYAAALADLMEESVHFVPVTQTATDGGYRFNDGVLEIRMPDDSWRPIRAAFRYVTQAPWTRIPVNTKTLIFNPVIACLAGGRNKLMASKAYELYNADLYDTGLEIHVPRTVRDVSLQEVPLWVRRFGGQAVVKVPYSNAGQGVYTIIAPEELDAFMAHEHKYDSFIVQSLVGNHRWGRTGEKGRLYHIGTVPDQHGNIYAADLRIMVCAGSEGFQPLAIYARRAGKPLIDDLSAAGKSWDMLGTNLSAKRADGGWDAETERLMLVDRRDFNELGVGLDDLVEGYIQTVLSTIAIDRMAQQLINTKGGLRRRFFDSLNHDESLLKEILE